MASNEAMEPAIPGSYGQPPAGYRLPDSLALGPVHLQISDLDRSLDYYQRVLGLALLERAGDTARLASSGGTAPLVILHEQRGARPAPSRGRTGLFHFAILLPDRASLGRFVRHLGEVGASAGAADHLISEAIYLQDPDNLGIEVYADRARSEWRRVGRELVLVTEPLDFAGLVREAGATEWGGMPLGAGMGHVHLHVGDLDRASAFYSEGLGLDRMTWDAYRGALFMSAGGYHHHLAVNLWAGSGATPPGKGDAQLLEWTIELPREADVAEAAGSLERGGFGLEATGAEGAVVRDPWGTRLRIRAPRR
ncbi:MAG TPA: VOC family protein [Gemmatimonadales bacterium]|nr:VOC family protein [Gemmatimonadales bacterium]